MSKAIVEWVILGDLAVMCASRGDVPNDRWLEYMEALRTNRVSKILASTVGPVNLTSIQRKQASEIADQLQITSAVVTDEQIVRGFMTALSWVGVKIKGFSWDDLDQAIQYLQVPLAMVGRVEQTAKEMRFRLQRGAGGIKSA
jgi:hypothetical protein